MPIKPVGFGKATWAKSPRSYYFILFIYLFLARSEKGVAAPRSFFLHFQSPSLCWEIAGINSFLARSSNCSHVKYFAGDGPLKSIEIEYNAICNPNCWPKIEKGKLNPSIWSNLWEETTGSFGFAVETRGVGRCTIKRQMQSVLFPRSSVNNCHFVT